MKEFNNKEVAVVFLLTISKKLQEKYDGEKTIFPVPILRFGLNFFPLPDDKNRLKTDILSIMKKKEEDFEDIAKLFTLHKIPLRELQIKLVLHYIDNTGELKHYYIETPIDKFIDKLNEISADLIRFRNVMEKNYNLKFLDIKDTLKQYDYAREFCNVILINRKDAK